MSLRPLEGVRVLEVGSDMAMSFGCRLLSDLGAEVIKIEPPGGGDPIRREGPFVPGEAHWNDSALFGYLNAGKHSITLDCGSATGSALLERLIGHSDVVVWAPATVEAPALERDDDASPGTNTPVMIGVTPYGVSGPGADRVGTPFVVQHAAGFALHQATPVTNPAETPPVACADREAALTVGLVVANSAFWGLEMVGRSNTAPSIDVSMEDVFAYLLIEPYADAASVGPDAFTRQRVPGSGTAVVGGLVWYLPCADGAIVVSPREDHQWANWVEVMDHPEWTADAELCGSRERRTANADKLQGLMSEWSETRSAQEIFLEAQRQRVACFPISTGADLLDNPQLEHRCFFSRLRFPNGAEVPVPGLPFLMQDSSGEVLRRGDERNSPALGGANDRVRREDLQLSGGDVEHLSRHRII